MHDWGDQSGGFEGAVGVCVVYSRCGCMFWLVEGWEMNECVMVDHPGTGFPSHACKGFS